MLSTHEDLKKKIESMEKKYDQQFQIIFEAIKQLLATDEKPKKKIGYTVKRHDGLDTLCINVPQNVS